MKKIILTILLIFFCGVISSFANKETKALLLKADSAYKAQDFKTAYQLWESLINKGYITDDLYYNMGNASYRMGDISTAIWFYKKAILLSKYNNNAKDNLNLLVNKGYAKLLPQPMGFTAFANNILTAIPYNILFWVTWSVFVLLSLFIFLFAFKKNSNRAHLFWLIVFSAIFFIYFFSSFIYQNININNSKNAIVATQSTNLYSSPDSLSIAIAIINEGTEVKCIQSIGNWQKILTPNQKTGWIQNNNLLFLKFHLPQSQ